MTEHVQKHLTAEFPSLMSDSRFIQLMPRMTRLLWAVFANLAASVHWSGFTASDPFEFKRSDRAQHLMIVPS